MLAPAGERLLEQARRLVAMNDEVWSSMRAPQFEGEVRFGVPYDITSAACDGDPAWFRQARRGCG